ncbi:MAG TPA: hypothetical protein VMM27_10370 [Casimicrobiaceae bacterium]|nr:hypothetical protein [Casimicrobiaceae bacterium]
MAVKRLSLTAINTDEVRFERHWRSIAARAVSVYESFGNGYVLFMSCVSGFHFNPSAFQHFSVGAIVGGRHISSPDSTARHILPGRVVGAVEDAISSAYTASAFTAFRV